MTACGYFITGTDTEVGKTVAAVGMIHALRSRGLVVLGMKPVACGGRRTDAGIRNEDAVALQHAGSLELEYRQVNPVLFDPPIAPHIAALEARRPVVFDELTEACRRLQRQCDRIVVEGVGGWRVPLGRDRTMADFASALGLPVVLVVGLRLGCLNHALLTAADVESHGLRLAGWVANRVDPGFERVDENIAALCERIPAPLIARFPWFGSGAPPPAASVAQPFGPEWIAGA